MFNLALTACSRSIIGDRNLCFTEGFHIVEHVKCGIH